ncbi:TPA: Rpn family recombination-promoting nuclease/putative transposase [Klebsiella oxytoca]|nr:Rpn family recombination-promoting nuclease/putative transposase [Klebsiella oxytoca]
MLFYTVKCSSYPYRIPPGGWMSLTNRLWRQKLYSSAFPFVDVTVIPDYLD